MKHIKPLGLVYGAPDTGKTTLVNALLKNEDRFTLLDHQGFDFYTGSDPKVHFANTLEANSQNALPEKQITFILYCISAPGNRFETYEVDMLNEVRKNYGVIVVLTKDFNDSSGLVRTLKEQLREDIPVIPVLAEKMSIAGTTIDVSGLDTLKDEICKQINECYKFAEQRATKYGDMMKFSVSKRIVEYYSKTRVVDVYHEQRRETCLNILVHDMFKDIFFIYNTGQTIDIFENKIEECIQTYTRQLPGQIMTLFWTLTSTIGLTTNDYGESSLLLELGLALVNGFETKSDNLYESFLTQLKH